MEGGKNTTSNVGENIMVGLIMFGIVVFMCLCALGTLCLYKWGCFPEAHGQGHKRNGGPVLATPDIKMQPLDVKLLQKRLEKLEVKRMQEERQEKEKEKVGMKALEHVREQQEVEICLTLTPSFHLC